MKINLEERKIVANLEAFIVPNSVNLFKDFYFKERIEAKYKKLLELSGATTCNLDDQYMIQMWYVSEEDLGSDNLVDHGFRFDAGNKKYFGGMGSLSYIPYCFLEGKKEGDVINVSFPIRCSISCNNTQENIEDWVLEAEITLKQQGYRYRRFGKFEDVLAALIH